jgi:hypothetical protein
MISLLEVKHFSVSMALVDYIPVIFFAIGAIILLRDLYNKMGKGAFALFSAGVIDVTMAGALKATYKLLYALGVCDFTKLDAMFFPVQSIGFLLAGVGIIAMLTHRQTEKDTTKLSSFAAPLMVFATAVAAPEEFTGTFVFVGLMVAGLGLLDLALCVLSKKLGKGGLIALYVFSFVCCLGMGYLSSKDFAEASMNWIAECVNVVGQGTFLLGAIILHKNGLADLTLEKK